MGSKRLHLFSFDYLSAFEIRKYSLIIGKTRTYNDYKGDQESRNEEQSFMYQYWILFYFHMIKIILRI